MYFSSFDLEVTQESSFSDLLNDLNYKDRHFLLLLMILHLSNCLFKCLKSALHLLSHVLLI